MCDVPKGTKTAVLLPADDFAAAGLAKPVALDPATATTSASSAAHSAPGTPR